MNIAQTIADRLNATTNCRYKFVAEELARLLNVGLYWKGTACPAPANPSAEVWKIVKGKWTVKLGTIQLGADDFWRA